MYGCDEDIAWMTTKAAEIKYQIRDLLGLLMFALGKIEEITDNWLDGGESICASG